MAKTVELKVEPRNELGSRANKRLRDGGKLPGVIYGHKEAVIPVAMPRKEIVQHLAKGAHVFDLQLDGKSEKVLVKEVQYNHLGNDPIHVDFARVSLDERVTVTVPLELRGTPKGEEDGGVLTQLVAELEVECLVTDIPDLIRHSVAEMKLDDVLHVRDLTLPPGVKALQDPELLVATVREVVDQAAASDVIEPPAEPELIGRKPGEGEEAAEEKK